jgi:hypothetical protein
MPGILVFREVMASILTGQHQSSLNPEKPAGGSLRILRLLHPPALPNALTSGLHEECRVAW